MKSEYQTPPDLTPLLTVDYGHAYAAQVKQIPQPPAPLNMSALLTQLVYTPQDLEPLLQLSKNTINALLNSGHLRAIRAGRKWLVPRDAVLEFLNPGSAR